MIGLGMWLVILSWVAAILAAEHLGASRNRSGWMWGLFLGWVGVIILACMSPTSATQVQVRELEAQLRLAELKKELQQSN